MKGLPSLLVTASLAFFSHLASALESAAVELGASASMTEKYARSMQAPLGALYRWTALNPEAENPPSYADLLPFMFAPPAIPGYGVTLSSVATGVFQLCVTARLTERFEAAGFSAASARAGFELAAPGTCATDNGEATRAPGLPRLAAAVRQVDRRRVLSNANLPDEPVIVLPTGGFIDLEPATTSSVLTVTNTSSAPLGLLDAKVSDTSFSVGSDCQTMVNPGATCEVEVSLAGALVAKKVARIQLVFSNGSNAYFSVRGTP